MSSPRLSLFILVVIGFAFLGGCTSDTSDLKQKIAELEKRVAKQEKDLGEFAGKFSSPKDFTADIQRLEDQQDRLAQAIKGKVEPITGRMEELRDWAQEAQSDREKVARELKVLTKAVSDLGKGNETITAEIGRVKREIAALKKHSGSSAAVQTLSNRLDQLRKETLENNTKLVNALKKTLPKVKSAAVTEMKTLLDPMEKKIANLTPSSGTGKSSPGTQAEIQAMKKRITELETLLAAQKSFLLEMGSKFREAMDKKMASLVPSASADKRNAQTAGEVQAMKKRIMDLEDILASQKNFLLEIGSRVHQIETAIGR